MCGKICPNIPPPPPSLHFSVKIFADVLGVRYICPRNIAHHLNFTPMSKVRIPINPMQVGRVGAYSMYVRKGEQIVRQRKNSSNYGTEASRTESQQTRRVKWANLVNFYKVCAPWMKKAFENKLKNQTDYNAFMSENIDKGHVCLTKSQAQAGCCVVDYLTVSKGSLPSLGATFTAGANGFQFKLNVGEAIAQNATIAWLSEKLILLNAGWANGDNLAFITFSQSDVSGGSAESLEPRVVSTYREFTLDTSNTSLLSAHPLGQYFSVDAQNQLAIAGSAAIISGLPAAVAIHTRLSGTLKVSSEQILMITDTIIDKFSTAEFLQICIDSYGVDESVPLDPSFSSGRITEILVNGVAINRDLTFGQAVELAIVGENMQGHVVVKHKNAVFTPLDVSEDGSTYYFYCTDNGQYKIYVNESLVRTITLQGIDIPSELTQAFNMRQSPNEDLSLADTINSIDGEGVCCQYPYMQSEEYPYFRFQLGFASEPTIEDFDFVNCTNNRNLWYSVSSNEVFNLSVTDTSKPAYIKYKEVIVAVFNYT